MKDLSLGYGEDIEPIGKEALDRRAWERNDSLERKEHLGPRFRKAV
jgi:hypothetical protein